MITTKRINAPPTLPYVVKYGPRSPQHFANPVHAFGKELDFVRPREGLDISELTALTPEWAKDTEQLIEQFDATGLF